MAIQGGMGIFDAVSGSDNVNQAGQGIANIGNQIQQESQMSPQQSSQYNSSFNVGQGLTGLESNVLQGTPEQQYQNQGPLAQSTYNQILNQAQNPLAGYQSALAPSLEQAQNSINEYYNSRGLDNSGIAIGAMGTAGVDLAIQNAQNEMTYQQQSLNNAGTLNSNISSLNQQNIGNLQGLYGTQQQQGLSETALQQQGYQAGAEYESYPYQSQLGYGYGQLAAAQAVPGEIAGQANQLGAAFLGGV